MRRSSIALGVVGLALAVWLSFAVRYPSDKTPEGAYARVAKSVNQGRPRDFFAYLETDAQHACYTIGEFRKRARERILAAYPDPPKTELAAQHRIEADAPDGADVWAWFADAHGFVTLLRRDVSGVAKVEISGERATVETVRGTRYAFRRRENGIWGMTRFTAALREEAERAARDFALVDQAAKDYERERAARRE
ncbi:MAG TPA: hypothetical protein VHE30_20455 [Polyangiaceae bacterium]|nr:hypothetical protein [Polyangiaceae bacterium]